MKTFIPSFGHRKSITQQQITQPHSPSQKTCFLSIKTGSG